jgi:hypothetical protein
MVQESARYNKEKENKPNEILLIARQVLDSHGLVLKLTDRLKELVRND